MFELKKKTTPVANIAFMAIMAAINVIFALLMAFIPYIMFLLILILPMTSVLVALFCQKRYYPLYIIVTLGLCFVSAIWDISIPLFYILPSMISGFLFAVFIKIKLPNLYLIVIPSLIQMAFNYLAVYLTYLITGINMIETIQVTMGLKEFDLFYVIVPAFIITISLIQSLFSYMILKDELVKFGIKINDENTSLFYANVSIEIGLLIITLLCGVFDVLNVAYLALVLASVFALDFIIKACISKPKLFIAIGLATLFINLVLFSALYQFTPKGTAFLLFGISYLLFMIYGIINKHLFLKTKVAKIEDELIKD